jgi:hypothetical protein
MAVLGMFFEHLNTAVNGVGEREVKARTLPSAIGPIAAHL